MSSSEDTECYISPSVSSSTVTLMEMKKSVKNNYKSRHSPKKRVVHMETVRRCQIKLIDDRKLDLNIHSKQTASELITEIIRQYHITEIEYFGLYYEDNDERMWLPSDKKLLDQEIFKRDPSTPTLYFAVRFVIKPFVSLQNATTVMLFFLSTRYSIYRGIIDTNDSLLFQLAAYVIQAVAGDYTNDEAAINAIKRTCVLPKRVIDRNVSRRFCEEQIINRYKTCRDMCRGDCIVKYMILAENLPSYGSHYFLVRNKNNIPAYLGISFIGISVYSYDDRETPVKMYYWRQLENLYYRDRKFSLEVHDLESNNPLASPPISSNAPITDPDDKLLDAMHDPSTQMSVGRRVPPTPNIKVRAWFTHSPQYCKAIWSMAVAQHQFYLDKRNCRQNPELQRDEWVQELNNSTMILTSDQNNNNGTLSRSGSTLANIVPNQQIEVDVQQLIDLMKTRKQHLENLLNEKMKDFGSICVLEKQMTGATSDDYFDINDSNLEPELKHHIVADLLNDQVHEIAKLNQLRQEYDIQSKIVQCAKKLLHDQAKINSSLLDSVLKQRFEFYTCVKEKLDRLTKVIETVQKEIQVRYPYADVSPVKTMAVNSGTPSPSTFPPRPQQQKSPSPTQLNRTASYKRALVHNQRTVPGSTVVVTDKSSEFDNQVRFATPLDRSQSSDRLTHQTSAVTTDSSMNRPLSQHTTYTLQAPSNNASSRNRVRDRKQQASLRHGQKSTSTSNTMLDDSSQTASQLRSLDRRHQRASPHNSSVNSNINKTPMKSSHTDIYGSLERNKHSKVSQPSLHGAILNGDGNERNVKTDHQAHDFYHLTPTAATATNNTSMTSTVVNVGTILQNQGSFDQIDSIPPPIPPGTHRSRRPVVAPPSQSVFQPHFDSSTSTAPKDSYYTISGSKDVSSHHHNPQNRSILADNFYNGPFPSKPPTSSGGTSQQTGMHRYDTSPLVVRRLDQSYPTGSQGQPPPIPVPRHQNQSYNRTQSTSTMVTSQGPSGRSNIHTASIQPSTLTFRSQSSQSSSSQSSGPNSGSVHVAEEFSEDVLGWLNNNHGNSATLV